MTIDKACRLVKELVVAHRIRAILYAESSNECHVVVSEYLPDSEMEEVERICKASRFTIRGTSTRELVIQ